MSRTSFTAAHHRLPAVVGEEGFRADQHVEHVSQRADHHLPLQFNRVTHNCRRSHITLTNAAILSSGFGFSTARFCAPACDVRLHEYPSTLRSTHAFRHECAHSLEMRLQLHQCLHSRTLVHTPAATVCAHLGCWHDLGRRRCRVELGSHELHLRGVNRSHTNTQTHTTRARVHSHAITHTCSLMASIDATPSTRFCAAAPPPLPLPAVRDGGVLPLVLGADVGAETDGALVCVGCVQRHTGGDRVRLQQQALSTSC
jgi:hypothetical protein